MAAAAHVDVEELVTCSICLDKMTRPKMLPCQHTFCLSCLLGFKTTDYIDCPQCRHKHKIPPNGIKGFSDNFLINSLLGILTQDETQDADDRHKCTNCENDVQSAGTLCGTCVLDPRMSVVENIHCTLALMKSHLGAPATAAGVRRNTQFLNEVGDKLVSEREETSATFDEMITTLQERKAALNETFLRGEAMQKLVQSSIGDKAALERFFKQITDEVDSKPDLAQLSLLEAECLKYFSWFKLLTDMTQQKTELRFGFTRPDWNDQGGLLQADSVKQWIRELGDLLHGMTLFEESADTSGGEVAKTFSPATTVYTAAETVASTSGVQVSPTARRTPVNAVHPPPSAPSAPTRLATKKQVQPGNLAPVNYKSKDKARAQILRPQSASAGLHLPSGIAYAAQADVIFCADVSSNRLVTVKGLDSPVKNWAQFGSTVVLSQPSDVAVSEHHDSVVISDFGNHRLVCLTLKGALKFTAGSKGRGKDKFLALRGVTCHGDFILAVDEENHRVSVLRVQEGTFVRNFGQKHLISPRCVVVGQSNEIHVTDTTEDGSLNGVNVFDWNGGLLRTIVVNDVLLRNPYQRADMPIAVAGITVDRQGFICIAQRNHKCLVVYTPSGQLHTYITASASNGFNCPQGIELMPNGKLIVCDTGNSQLQIV